MTHPHDEAPILAAVDERAYETVLRDAAWLASYLTRPVDVLSVLHSAPVLAWAKPAMTGEPSGEQERILRGLLDIAVSRLAKDQRQWHVEVARGDPARMIASAARSAGASLIVMGLGRQRPLDRLLGAETTLATIRMAHCPVLALATEMREVPKTVVVATDFSATSATAVQRALPLLDAHATLVFVHAWQPTQSEAIASGNEAYQRTLPDRFAHFVETLELPGGMTARREIVEGEAAERVLDVADQAQADLIVMGRHGRGAFERLLVGSVAKRILRGTTRSVYVVPERVAAARSSTARMGGITFSTADRNEWSALLAGFTAENAQRQTVLSVSDTNAATASVDRGYQLVRISYDAGDPMEIVLGEPSGARHVTRTLMNVVAITLVSDDAGRHRSLHIDHGSGETVVAFMSDEARIEVGV